MSRRITFPTGLNEVGLNWELEAFEWALMLDTWVQDETTQVFMADIAADELTHASYNRVAMATPSTTVVLPAVIGDPGYVRYLCASPSFGVIAGGEIATSLVLIRFVTNDADSPIVASYPCFYTANGVDTAAVVISSTGALSLSTTCPTGF